MDSLQTWHRRAGDPFPSTLLVTTVSSLQGRTVGECFMLVDNGKIYLNGQRITAPESASMQDCHTKLQQAAHKLLNRMVKASLQNGAGAVPDVELTKGFEASDPDQLTALCKRPEYASYLRWIADKAASPALSALIKLSL